jgi:hypothetical protein
VLARELKKGTPRNEIVRLVSEKHGFSKITVRARLREAFPKTKTKPSTLEINEMLWKTRERISKQLNEKKKNYLMMWQKMRGEPIGCFLMILCERLVKQK